MPKTEIITPNTAEAYEQAVADLVADMLAEFARRYGQDTMPFTVERRLDRSLVMAGGRNIPLSWFQTLFYDAMVSMDSVVPFADTYADFLSPTDFRERRTPDNYNINVMIYRIDVGVRRPG